MKDRRHFCWIARSVGILGEFADAGLVSLGRGRINVLDTDRMRTAGGE